MPKISIEDRSLIKLISGRVEKDVIKYLLYQFRRGGETSEDQFHKWKRKKNGSPATLVRTGHLRRSFNGATRIRSKNSCRIFIRNRADYAYFVDLQRKIVYFNAAIEKKIEKIINEEVEKHLKKQLGL